ncbi:quinone oxidoreductase [Phaeovulum sp.]|uniref:quinone oxidoreductase family protein n=1 Tax=Phaeovulum sp. TaxID=2934796 RepID=UPI00356817E6
MMAYAMAIAAPGGTEKIFRKKIKVPRPGPGEITLRHTAIGLNFIDIYFRSGVYPWPVPRDLVTGSEGAGVVEAVGEGVDLRVGQRVAYTTPNGAYASHRSLPATLAVPLPDTISDEVAAAVMLKGLTAYYLLHHSFPVTSSDTVLFHAAAGGVGLLAGQWLAAKGVRAIGTAGGAEKCALARAHGYREVIDYRAEDFAAETMRLTAGQGVAAVYDSIGFDTILKSAEVLQPFGTLVSFGQSSGVPDNFRISHLARASLRVTRPTLFHFTRQPGWLAEASGALFKMIASGAIKVEIAQRYPLDAVGSAHEALAARQTVGSSILVP